MIRKFLIGVALGLIGGLVACTGAPRDSTPTRAQISNSTLPPMKSFATPRPFAPIQSNGNIAADFLDLSFQLESGRALPVFTRFETPVTVRISGTPPPSLQPDLKRLLHRLQTEAGIDIRLTPFGQANITIQAVSREEIRRVLPQAACFVVPNVTSLEQFRRERRRPSTNWALLRRRDKLAIFLPYDSSPQEVRDCLHEELAQALGPLNDLYRLQNSVFNDDNVHTVLTGFDMLILRTTYAPELQTGMTRAEVTARLPGILARLNPRGGSIAANTIFPTPRNWIQAVQTTLGPGATLEQRQIAANKAAQIALDQRWDGHRRAFSHYMLGRTLQGSDPGLAQRHFNSANSFLARKVGTGLHRAYVTTQTAAYAITRGDGASALRQIQPALDTAARAENAALLSTLMLLQVEALRLTGQHGAADKVRLDSLGWARYGFGADWAVKAKIQEISALNPLSLAGG
ncbi:MAG: DUF2927 domain-containing protein [Rhodobacteraceae bacterium]|nr:DUF2927 domain-containing protein [Paracoccaceae bacterium]